MRFSISFMLDSGIRCFFDCGLVSTPEPFQSLRNQGLIVARSYQASTGSYVDPADVIERNGEYVHKATGEKLRSQVEKMSKSKLNGITPMTSLKSLALMP